MKIACTLRADPDGPAASIFRNETRAIATDRSVRVRFRLYRPRYRVSLLELTFPPVRSRELPFARRPPPVPT